MTIITDSSPLPVRSRAPMFERIYLEGLEFSNTFANKPNFTATGAGNTELANPGLDPTSFYPASQLCCTAQWIESLVLSANKSVAWNVQVGSANSVLGPSSLGAVPNNFIPVITAANTPFVLPVRQLFRPFMQGSINLFVKKIYDADPSGLDLRAAATGVEFCDDLNWDADRTILVLGDSISRDAGPTHKFHFLPWLFRQYYEDHGQSVRMANFSVSGARTSGIEAQRAGGRLGTFPQQGKGSPGGIYYHAGMNEAGASILADAAGGPVENLTKAIAWKQAYYPDAHFLCLGPSPAENNTTEGFLATYRTGYSAAVTAAADSKVHYFNLGNSFDRTQGTAVYWANDTAGDRKHPNNAGNDAMWAALSAWLPDNLPRIVP